MLGKLVDGNVHYHSVRLRFCQKERFCNLWLQLYHVFAVWLKTCSNLHRLTALVGNQTLGNLLLEFDADIDAQNAEGATALILAIKAPQKWWCLLPL